MKFTWVLSFTGVFCYLAVFSTQGEVIYHQTMTPSWLEAHASFLNSFRTATAEKLTFNVASVDHGVLLKVPMIPPGVLRSSTPLTIEITVGNEVSIGKNSDSDISYGVSDGITFLGFETCDRRNYNFKSPCYGVEGLSGSTLTSFRYSAFTPKPTDSFYPGQFVFTLKLDERWGSCYTAHDGGFVKIAGYNNRLMLTKGLTLEVYKEHGDRVAIKYIKVVIIQDNA